MDVYCARCGEPWDIVEIEENPSDFRRTDWGAIVGCPCCAGKPAALTKNESDMILDIYAIAADIDEAAMLFEDARYLGWFDEDKE